MEKLMYVAWGDPAVEAHDELRDSLLERVAPSLSEAGARGITIAARDSDAREAVRGVTVPPSGEAAHIATIQLWVDAYDRCQRELDRIFKEANVECSGYLVVESTYENYGDTPFAPPRNWANGTRSPGIIQVALILFRPDRPYRDIIRARKQHAPVSASIHPRTRYVRNEVIRAITPGAFKVDGIVDEGFPSAAHVNDLDLYYRGEGDPVRLEAQGQRMNASVEAFVDMPRCRASYMSEYFVSDL